jgi:hypothetical protein
VIKSQNYAGEFKGRKVSVIGLWFYFIEKENFAYDLVKVCQELFSFGLKTTFVVFFHFTYGSTTLDST